MAGPLTDIERMAHRLRKIISIHDHVGFLGLDRQHAFAGIFTAVDGVGKVEAFACDFGERGATTVHFGSKNCGRAAAETVLGAGVGAIGRNDLVSLQLCEVLLD